MALEWFICILIPVRTHLTMGVKYEQPVLLTILMQLNVLLHVPRLNLHASGHFVTLRRPRQVRACRFFFFFHRAEPCVQRPAHVSLSRLHFAVSRGQPNSQEVKCCQKATQPTKTYPQESRRQVNCSFFPHPQMRDLLLSPPRLGWGRHSLQRTA